MDNLSIGQVIPCPCSPTTPPNQPRRPWCQRRRKNVPALECAPEGGQVARLEWELYTKMPFSLAKGTLIVYIRVP